MAWKGLGYSPVAFSEIAPFQSALLAHHYPEVPNLGDLNGHSAWSIRQPDLIIGGTPCQSFSVAGKRGGLEDARGQLMYAFLELVASARPRVVVWENVPVYCLRVRDEILEPLSGRWGTWGMGGPIESWTLNGSESPSGAVACSLSDVLEPMSAVLERCYLSPKACAGILRRAEKRGKTIPAPLETALRAACSLPE